MSNRIRIRRSFVAKAKQRLSKKLQFMLEPTQKGDGTLASSHESLGLIKEEFEELTEAVRSGDLINIREELLDIAVLCVFTIACIEAKTMDW